MDQQEGNNDKPRANSPETINSSDASVGSDVADGEYRVLMKSLEEEEEEESVPLSPQHLSLIKRTLSGTIIDDESGGEAVYGRPLSVNDAMDRMPTSDGGMTWYATIIPDEYFVDGKLKKMAGISRKDFCSVEQQIKPRRPSLPLTASDFFSSLTKIPGTQPRYIFYGILNGWPSLRCFEVVSLEVRRDRSTGLPSAREILSGQILWKQAWHVREEGAKGIEPSLPEEHQICRAKLRGAPWTARGWAKESPGFAFWYEAHLQDGPRLSYGTKMCNVLDDAKCSMIHMVSHRYAVKKEYPRDRLTYHSVCFLEWEHGQYGTVVESAYLNGMGGYKGKSNWYDDRDERVTDLYKHLPPEMICAWRTNSAEIRCYDVEARNLSQFMAFIKKYEGSDKRFVDPQVSFSHRARLTFRSKSHIAQYLLNYISRDTTYAELSRNCQTFSADLCCFLAGKKDVQPFHPVSRQKYQNRTYLFLYDSHMYDSRKYNT